MNRGNLFTLSWQEKVDLFNKFLFSPLGLHYLCHTFKQFAQMNKSYEEINEKIRKGKAVVLTAEEVSEMAKTMKPKEILDKVDVVTTATFGAMCSSGAFLNFGHANPPIRMERIEINGVPVSGGLAAVNIWSMSLSNEVGLAEKDDASFACSVVSGSLPYFPNLELRGSQIISPSPVLNHVSSRSL